MKPDILNNMVKISSSKQDNIVSFDDELNEFKDSDISIQSIKDLILKANTLIDHINNNNAHISNQERANFASILNTYTTYENLYVSKNDRINWNGKETPAGSQQKADIVQDNLDKHIYNDDIHVTKKLKLLWNDKYTRNEIDNKFSWIMYDTVYLDAVLTYTDIATTYPNPNKKDTVYVADTGITYRYNGIKWITLSINLIPLATAELDGRMSKTDKSKLDKIEDEANNYTHPADEFTNHVTNAQIITWNDKKDKGDFVVGNSTFNTVIGVEIPHTFGTPDLYAVSITLTSDPANVGGFWVKKGDNKITVYCTGVSIIDTFDYQIIKK